MKQRKNLANILGICTVLTMFGGCQNKNTEVTKPTDTTEIIQPTKTLETGTDTTMTQDTAIHQQLVIHPGCIGCGHCTRTAPINFAMSGRQAVVVSQDNIDASEVQQAVSRCPAQVIEVIEA